MASGRYFTVEEASAALPEVERLLVRLRELRTFSEELQANLSTLWDHLHEGKDVLDGLLGAQRELDVHMSAAQEVLDRLGSMGCVLRDLDQGLVDFPALAEGQEVFLCWRLGEHGIGFWHGATEGFAGRKPLAMLPRGPVH